ncbi:hypothetical protein M752DRAFT_128992 [Aspergillus phoenicis ATCC 13157]|uniref:Uncharacterized protein n=1 Tax=Aspergillus phoenicis ATCC 13157 TaxID=1353007 RepID=A0A370PRS6_ASPPH|nr:hypothetical protein M752DRAFT_128992 [Aspergillus phoenicis ATCC 13157]
MLDDSGTTAPGHHPSVTGWCIVSAAYILLLPLKQRSSRVSNNNHRISWKDHLGEEFRGASLHNEY